MPENLPSQNPDTTTDTTPIETDGPGHIIIIDLVPDTSTVTGPTTVNWQVTLNNYSGPSQPTPSLSFYEVVPSATSGLFEFRPITVSPSPTVLWNGSVGSFAVVMESSIFSQFQSRQTSFAVKAEIPNVESSGLSKIDIDLPPA